uniref:Chitin-binding type-2 domain-containing protein n=1 Tax=Stomoxys calcitrans TaxID=35570 RepID=A0A1I8PU01_STOCA
MKAIYALACLLLTLTVSSAATLSSENYARYICHTREDGFRILVPGSCSLYYECKNGQPKLGACPFFFDSENGICTHKDTGCVEGPMRYVEPRPDQAIEPVAVKPMEPVPEKHIEPVAEQHIEPVSEQHIETLPEQHIEPPTTECTTKSTTECTTTEATTTECTTKSTTECTTKSTTECTTTEATTTECTTKSTTECTSTKSTSTECTTSETTTDCSTTLASTTSCSSTTACTATTTKCTTTAVTPCANSANSAIGAPALLQPPQTLQSNIDMYMRFVCRDKPNNFLVASLKSCNQYYMCQNGIALPVSCGRLYFNALKGTCDLPENTGCIQSAAFRHNY